MKIALLSSTKENEGPANVHRGFVAHWPKEDSFYLVTQESKLHKLFDSIIKGLMSDVVISGDTGWSELLACKVLRILGKRIVCLSHSYLPFENDINNLGLSQRKLNAYLEYLLSANAVVANSQQQMRLLISMQPELQNKIHYVNNAVDPFAQLPHKETRPDVITVAVSGGSRPIKRNEFVGKAVQQINSRGLHARLMVYGNRSARNDELDALLEDPCVQMMGHVSSNEFIAGLQQTDVFVMNSQYESFGLSVLDALHAGASVLLSKNCGVMDVIDAKPSDTIERYDDVDELADKIISAKRTSNSQRLYRSIDFSSWNWTTSANQMASICHEYARGQRG